MTILRRTVLFLIAAFVLLSSAAPMPSEEGEARICEKALWVCLSQPGHNLPWDLFECLGGYGYCKKYIEPLLGLPG